MKKLWVLGVAVIAGCASYQPIVDMAGVSQERYSADLSACQRYAGQVSPGEHAAAGAAAGAVLGAALGALFGNRQSAGQLGAAYGLIGGTAGAARGADSQVNVVRNCMAGRGYRVLH